MIKIENKNAFAIRFSNSLTPNMLAFLEMIENAARLLPRFKAEGVNKKLRDMVEIKKTPEYILPDFNGGKIEMGTIDVKYRNLLGVGIDGKLDVAFVAEKDLKVSSNFSIVPIFDIDRHYGEIKKWFRAYLEEVYEVKRPEPKVTVAVTQFSNFVKVGNSRVDRNDLAALGAMLGVKPKKEPKKKTIKVVVDGLNGLLL